MTHKTAIVLIGEMRFKSPHHFDSFLKAFEGYDIFVSTYEEYEGMCCQISNKCRLHPRDSSLAPAGSPHLGAWFNLNSIVEDYADELLKYDNILKVRTDLMYPSNDFVGDIKNLQAQTLYANSDILFYSRSDYFVQIFKGLFSKITTDYWDKVKKYIPLNYDNILQSAIANERVNYPASSPTAPKGVRFNWLVLPQQIIDAQKPHHHDFNKFKEIIKENYDFLSFFNCNYNADSPVGSLRNFSPSQSFSAEQTFALHAFNSGSVKNSSIQVGLYGARRSFSKNIF